MTYINLSSAVQSIIIRYRTESSSDSCYFLPHRMGDMLWEKNNQNNLNLQHTSNSRYDSIAEFRIKMFLSFFLFFLLIFISSISFSGPWLSPSAPYPSSANMATKSDIDLLANYGFIEAPVLTWPIAWDNVGPSLLSEKSKEEIKSSPRFVQDAYFRVLSQYQGAIQTSLKKAAYAGGGGNINPFRTFDYQPRSNFEAGAAAEKQGKHWAGRLALNYGTNKDLTKYIHLDNSYFYAFLGNWGIGFDKMNRWWSPAYTDSLILSANAAPLPTFTIQRMRAEAFETKWLHWIGPWSVTSSLSIGGEEPISELQPFVPHPLIWITNFVVRPIESLQFSVSRNVFFAGDTRPLNNRMLYNVINGIDNCSPEFFSDPLYCQKYSPGTELAEVTVEWSPKKIFKYPFSIYLHTVFKDLHPYFQDTVHLPWRTSFILGTNSAFPLFKGMLRVYVENEYLVENAYWLWNINDKYHENFKIDNIYGYSQYPYYYYNKIIGSPLGGEAKALNLGAIYTHPSGNSTNFMARVLRLNSYNLNVAGSPGYPFDRQNVLWLSVTRTITLPKNRGQLSGQLGYLQSLNGTGLKSSPSGFLTWSKNF